MDIKKLDPEELTALAAEIRRCFVQTMAHTGGHLASNLGAVELTLAIHRVYDTSRDRLVFDVGHQCYTHKLLTGRQEGFRKLRAAGGVSGFPSPTRAFMTPLSPAMPPTPSPWRWGWPGRGRR